MELDTIYNEDCRFTMAKMPKDYIDLTVTSPPYDTLRSYNNADWSFLIFKEVARELFRITKNGGVVVWVVGDKTYNKSESCSSFLQALYFKEIGFNLHDTMIYSADKPPLTHNRYEQKFEYMFIFVKGKLNTFNPIMEPCLNPGATRTYGKGKKNHDELINGSDKPGHKTKVKTEKIKGNIWHYRVGANDRTDHPAVFPEQLAIDHIKSWSNEGDLVYDCFMGSGTTAKCCKVLKRHFIGSEISEEYCQIANSRINKDYGN